ncbi:glycyl-radical enzyme activating protein [Caviibacter abscessus]|uniref:glycyl-radical enzyme activating protein n=1 Tax=Caviibacter abscessus TaxID=1766719 RepID=UPI0008354023
MKKARIFNLQKFSLHDGPGIRTVVFFKGCPLKCPWCSNPESQKKEIQLVWKDNKCNYCEDCGITELLWLSKDGEKLKKGDNQRYVNLKKITEEEAIFLKKRCKTGSISYEGYDKDLEDIISEIKKDMPFYEQSGGGVTVSGGEVLTQADIATQLLKRCKEEGIHTAAETTCYAPENKFIKFVEQLDLLLCDVKHWDNEKSKRILGVPLDRIKSNIKYATSVKTLEVIGRIPVIPKFNYTIEDAKKISELLVELGIKNVELLPYHNFGENKYKLLNIPYEYEDVEQLHKDDEKFIEYKRIFVDAGLNVK